MDPIYFKELLEDIKKLAAEGDVNGIIAICDNELEEIDKYTIKQEIVELVRGVSEVKYKISKLKCENKKDLYELTDVTIKNLKRLVRKKELNTTTGNENV